MMSHDPTPSVSPSPEPTVLITLDPTTAIDGGLAGPAPPRLPPRPRPTLIGEPTIDWGDGHMYEGQVRNGSSWGCLCCGYLAHGQGTMIGGGENNTCYRGEWKMNQPDGHGTKWYDDECVYVGSWKNGKRHGQGKLYNNLTGRLLKAGYWHEDVWVRPAAATVDNSAETTRTQSMYDVTSPPGPPHAATFELDSSAVVH